MNHSEELDKLPVEMVGDNGSPNVYFVSVEGHVVLVTVYFDLAYDYWRFLPRNIETSFEDRQMGTIASTEPVEDGSKNFRTIDDAHMVKNFRTEKP